MGRYKTGFLILNISSGIDLNWYKFILLNHKWSVDISNQVSSALAEIPQ